MGHLKAKTRIKQIPFKTTTRKMAKIERLAQKTEPRKLANNRHWVVEF